MINQQRSWSLTGAAYQPGNRESAPETLTRTSRILFLLTSALLVLNAFDVPFLGVSLTTPLMGLIILEIIFRPRFPFIQKYRAWLMWAFVFVAALFIVQAVTAASEQLQIVRAFLPVIQYTFWIIAFIAVLYVSHDVSLMKQTAFVLGVSLLILGGIRVTEGLLFDKWGAWTRPLFLTQNTYGIQFSTFVPFAVYFVFAHKGMVRLFGIGMLGVVVFALLMNGSRSSWIAVAAGLFVAGLIYTIANPKYIALFIGASLATVLAAAILYPHLPPQMRNMLEERIDTFAELDSDKSYLIRQLMIQKGIKLFMAEPLFGTGVGRFRDELVILELPPELQYGSQQHFNAMSAHNSYIVLLGETGLFGFLPFAVLLGTIVLAGAPAAIKLQRRGYTFAPFIFASFCGMSIHMWTLAGLTGTHAWYIYAYCIGMIYLARSLPAEPAAQPAQVAATATKAT